MSYSDDQYQGLKAERDALKAENRELKLNLATHSPCAERFNRMINIANRYREVLEEIGKGGMFKWQDSDHVHLEWYATLAKVALAEGGTNAESLGETK